MGVGIGSGDHMERMLKQAQGPSFKHTLTANLIKLLCLIQNDNVALLPAFPLQFPIIRFLRRLFTRPNPIMYILQLKI